MSKNIDSKMSNSSYYSFLTLSWCIIMIIVMNFPIICGDDNRRCNFAMWLALGYNLSPIFLSYICIHAAELTPLKCAKLAFNSFCLQCTDNCLWNT